MSAIDDIREGNKTMAAGCLILVLIVPAGILDAWVITMIWGWYVVPLFDLPQISIIQTMGVGAVIRLLTGYETPRMEFDEDASVGEIVLITVGRIIGVPLFVLLLMWVLSWYV